MRPSLHGSSTTPTVNQRRGLVLWLLILLLSITVGTLTTLLLGRPDLAGLARVRDQQATDTQISATVVALQSTADSQATRRADISAQGLHLRETQAALDNRAAHVAGTETQQAVNQAATQTAIADSNAQQATESALSYRQTQTALEQIATQAQQEFSATQTALASALGTPVGTALPSIVIFDGDSINPSESQFGSGLPVTAAWSLVDNSLVAQADAATLLLSQPPPSQFIAELSLTTPGTPGVYHLFVGVPANGSGTALSLSIIHDGQRITDAGLFTIDAGSVGQPGGVLPNQGQALDLISQLEMESDTLRLRLDAADGTLSAQVNGLPLLSIEGTQNAGRIGVQVPRGTTISRLLVAPYAP